MGSASLGVRLHKMWSSLAFRVALLLTLSILPIGAIAIYQTFVLSRALDDSASRKLLASTIKVMATEEVAIERSIGTARAVHIAAAHGNGGRANVSNVHAFGHTTAGGIGYRYSIRCSRQ